MFSIFVCKCLKYYVMILLLLYVLVYIYIYIIYLVDHDCKHFCLFKHKVTIYPWRRYFTHYVFHSMFGQFKGSNRATVEFTGGIFSS